MSDKVKVRISARQMVSYSREVMLTKAELKELKEFVDSHGECDLDDIRLDARRDECDAEWVESDDIIISIQHNGKWKDAWA